MAENDKVSGGFRSWKAIIALSAAVVFLILAAVLAVRFPTGKREKAFIDNSDFFTDIPKMNLEVLDIEGHASRISGNRVDLVPFKGVYSIDLDKASVVRHRTESERSVSVSLPDVALDIRIDEKNVRNIEESEKKGFWDIVKGWFRFSSKTASGITQAKLDDEAFRNDVKTRLMDEVYMEAARQQGIVMTRQLLSSLNDSDVVIRVSYSSSEKDSDAKEGL